MCSSHGLVQLVSRPTRITDSSATLIDQVYTNNVDNIKSCNILTVDLTDHLATHTKISFKTSGGTLSKSGANCEYFHPTICKHSLSRRVCTYKDCTFVHLKGTKRAEPTQANLLGSSNPQKKPDRSVKGGSSDSSEEHFLELKRLVSEMTSNFNQEISNIKASLLHVQIHASKNAHFQPHPLPLMNQFPSTQYHQMPPPVQGMPYIPQSSF